MIRVGVLMSVLAFGTVAFADPPAPPAADADRVQGYWKPLQCDFEGKPQMPTEVMKQVTVVFDKSEYHLYFKDTKLDKDNKPVVFRLALAQIALDPSTNPKGITFEFADGPLRGRRATASTNCPATSSSCATARPISRSRPSSRPRRQRVLPGDVGPAGEVGTAKARRRRGAAR
jgi:uncharacterized protein (TIGR03067 family)